jgi:tRNA-dihydrouridine synthase
MKEVGVRGEVIKISVAPMMDCTDRHFRWFMRQISRRSLLYTEMVTMGAVLHGDREHLLGFSPEERPLALQLGGDDPVMMAECARIGEGMGYDEININVGCPSDRVASGNFGACLMAQPERVAACVAAMRAAVQIPVTVKHRIGIDDRDSYEHMVGFVNTVAAAGCDRFTVHARKAVLGGLSPKENRTVPPLRPDDVYRLKAELPELRIEINGGVSRSTRPRRTSTNGRRGDDRAGGVRQPVPVRGGGSPVLRRRRGGAGALRGRAAVRRVRGAVDGVAAGGAAGRQAVGAHAARARAVRGDAGGAGVSPAADDAAGGQVVEPVRWSSARSRRSLRAQAAQTGARGHEV